MIVRADWSAALVIPGPNNRDLGHPVSIWTEAKTIVPCPSTLPSAALLDWQREVETAALAGFAFYPDFAALGFYQQAADGEAQPGALADA